MAGGDVRVGRRAVSSDTARGVGAEKAQCKWRLRRGGAGGSWMEARVAVVVVIWYTQCGHGPTKGTLRSSLLWVPASPNSIVHFHTPQRSPISPARTVEVSWRPWTLRFES